MASDASIEDILAYEESSGTKFGFLAKIISNLVVVPDRSIPIAAVTILDRRYAFMYNSNWVSSATYPQILTVVIHEAYHILLNHITRGLLIMQHYAGEYDEQTINLCRCMASDLVVNWMSKDNVGFDPVARKELGGIMPGEPPFEKMPAGLPVEEYMELLLKERTEQQQQLQKALRDAMELLKEKSDNPDELGEAMRGLTEENDESEDGDEPEDGDGGPEDGDGDECSGCGGGSGADGDGDSEGDGQDGEARMTKSARSRGAEIRKKLQEAGLKNLKSQDVTSLTAHALVEKTFQNMPVDDARALQEELEYQAEQAIRSAYEAHKNRGTIPGSIRELIEKSLLPPTVPWTRLIHNAAVSARRGKAVRSIARSRRRYAGVPGVAQFPGRVKDNAYKIVFNIDTSGSMGTRECQLALSELRRLQKADDAVEITVIESDTQIGREYTIGPTDQIKPELTGRGGTDFNVAMERSKQLKPDICFFFTDGYAPAPEPKHRLACPFYWIITPNGVCPDHVYGKCVYTGKAPVKK